MSDLLTAFFGQPGSKVTRRDKRSRARAAGVLAPLFPQFTLYPESLCAVPGGLILAAREGFARKLIACGATAFQGVTTQVAGLNATVADATPENMRLLRECVPFLRPVLPGRKSSVGLGDRTGLATPGHIEAAKGSGFFLVLAQQSIREMQRTGRSAQQVLDEATFGVFQSGFDKGFGTDADHLKTAEDVDLTAAAGFISFTLDPSAHVDDTVNSATPEELAAKFERLVADHVPGAANWRKDYVAKTLTAGTLQITFDEPTLLRAAVKYGRAVAHVETLARHIAGRVPKHEIELSVDETALPTSVAEHLFIANELKRRKVKIHSLAPRYIGDFEKGIDYKGDVKAFEEALQQHAQIARHYGPYKLSIHSGSDKFTLYPIVARVTGGWFHLKTAGTSYLEALRVVARRDTVFFREIVAFCRSHYDADKKTYHVSAVLDAVPAAEGLDDAGLERVYLDENAGRQILHVTFGSVLTYMENGQYKFRNRLLELLNREAPTYVEVLVKHIGRHLAGLRA